MTDDVRAELQRRYEQARAAVERARAEGHLMDAERHEGRLVAYADALALTVKKEDGPRHPTFLTPQDGADWYGLDDGDILRDED